jgi:hypothetical protein
VPSTRLDGAGSTAAATAAGTAAGTAGGATAGGSPGAAADGRPVRGGPSDGPVGAARARPGGRDGPVGAGRARSAGGAGAAAPRTDETVPVHAPPPNQRRRLVPSPLRVANRRLDEGLFDAGAPGRPAPEDDARGYLSPVRVEVADDELSRLFDPARPARPARSGSGRT